MNKTERFQKLLEDRDKAEKEAGPPPIAPVDDAMQDKQRAQSTIQFDGRTGRATTLLKNVVPDETQPRKAKNIDPQEIVQLAASIKNGEQIQPIVVDWWPELQKWKIVVGERRWMAHQAAGLERIACVFKTQKMDPIARKLMQGVENIHRANLTDLERAEYFREMIELTGWTQKRLAEEMHLHPGTISRALDPELRGATAEPELRGATQPRKRKGKGGPKPGRVHIQPMQDEHGHVHTIKITSPHGITKPEAARLLRLAADLLDEQGQGSAAA